MYVSEKDTKTEKVLNSNFEEEFHTIAKISIGSKSFTTCTGRRRKFCFISKNDYCHCSGTALEATNHFEQFLVTAYLSCNNYVV